MTIAQRTRARRGRRVATTLLGAAAGAMAHAAAQGAGAPLPFTDYRFADQYALGLCRTFSLAPVVHDYGPAGREILPRLSSAAALGPDCARAGRFFDVPADLPTGEIRAAIDRLSVGAGRARAALAGGMLGEVACAPGAQPLVPLIRGLDVQPQSDGSTAFALRLDPAACGAAGAGIGAIEAIFDAGTLDLLRLDAAAP